MAPLELCSHGLAPRSLVGNGRRTDSGPGRTRHCSRRGRLRFAPAASRLSGAVRPTAEVPAGLVVTRDGTAFRAPGAPTADLGRRLAQRRLLQRLVAERERVPGRPLSVEVLFEAGWPGDRSRRTAALNRVHVALATLRGLGLRAVLVRRGGGYLLDPEVPVSLVDALVPEN